MMSLDKSDNWKKTKCPQKKMTQLPVVVYHAFKQQPDF